MSATWLLGKVAPLLKSSCSVQHALFYDLRLTVAATIIYGSKCLEEAVFSVILSCVAFPPFNCI